jgi:LacI family transcriptional regulator
MSSVRVTIKQIAEQSGLSVPTVSRILRDEGHAHQPATRERVLRVASEMGYRPNTSARAMRSGRFGAVALLQSGTDQVRSLLPPSLLNGILASTGAHELHLTVAALPDEQLTDRGYMPRILREWSVDGLLINYNTDIPEQMAGLIAHHGIPAVWINSVRDADCVFPEDEAGGRAAAEHLLRLGHSRIAYLTPRPGHYSDEARERGYVAAMHAAGLPPRTVLTFREEAPDGLMGALRGQDRPTALVGYNTEATRAAFFHAIRAGLSVPGDLSLIGFSTMAGEPLGILPVDTMAHPGYEMGQRAVRMLLHKIEDPEITLPPCPVPHRLEVGETCAPPRQ